MMWVSSGSTFEGQEIFQPVFISQNQAKATKSC